MSCSVFKITLHILTQIIECMCMSHKSSSDSTYLFLNSCSYRTKHCHPNSTSQAITLASFAFNTPKIWNELPNSATSIAPFRKKAQNAPVCKAYLP